LGSKELPPLVIKCWVDRKKKSKPVQQWIAELDDQSLNQIDKLLHLLRLERRRLSMPYSRHLGEGLCELRDPRHSGPGYRLYYCWQGDVVVILLAAGDKSSQESDIELARRRMRDREK